MKKVALLLALTLCLLSFGGCSKDQPRSVSFFVMDTVITVTLYGTDEQTSQEIFSHCNAMLTELESLWSRQKTESDVSRLNAAASGEVALDARTASVLRLAREVEGATDGAFDVTLAPLCDLWDRCGEENRMPAEEELRSLLAHTGADTWSLSGDGTVYKNDAMTAFNLGGIGKGAAADALMEYLRTTDVSGGMVTFGSNVAVLGSKPNGKDFRIAVRDPKDADGYVGALTLKDGDALSVSGDYERFVTIGGERYHHVLDPQTGYPSSSGLSSVAIVCKSGALADALSTACLVMGYDRAMELYASGAYDFEAVFVFSDGTVRLSDGLLPQWQSA